MYPTAKSVNYDERGVNNFLWEDSVHPVGRSVFLMVLTMQTQGAGRQNEAATLLKNNVVAYVHLKSIEMV